MPKKISRRQQDRALQRRKERTERQRRLRYQGRQSATTEQEWEGAPPAPAPPRASADERALRSAIQQYAFQPTRFAADFDQAMGLFWGERARRTKRIEVEEHELADFQEWYFFDFVTANGDHLIDRFAQEVGPTLPATQQTMLADWIRTNRLRLLEVQEVTPGVGETLQDLLSGEIFHAHDVSLSRSARRWQIVVARTLFTEGRWHFTGSGLALPPQDKKDLLAAANSLWAAYRTNHPDASLDAFYRDASLELRRLAREIRDRPPYDAIVTAEGHPAVETRAEYRVRNFAAVEERLDAAEEFAFAGPSAEEPGALHYNWLQRGRSVAPAAIEPPPRALSLRTEWFAAPGTPGHRTLGDVTLSANRLVLSCLSHERLALGKALLEGLLGDLITHRRDRSKPFRPPTGGDQMATPAPRPAPFSDPADEALHRAWVAEQALAWLDQPLPALDNLTPRQAARDPEKRDALLEVFKFFEYNEEGKRLRGQYAVDVAAVRRELGV